MLRVNDPALYAEALIALQRFTRGNYYGRLAQIFLACKYYGDRVPPVGSPVGTDVSAMQTMLDDLYEKPSLRPGASIAILFNNNHLYRTGEAAPGAVASNIWRNNFNIQKGFGCYGSAAEILDPVFRNSSRTLCPHLRTSIPKTLEGATCALDTSQTKARYRREDHPKVFRVDPATRELFVYNTSDTVHYAPLVVPPKGRLPIGPLLIAIYHDSVVANGRRDISIDDFLLDFGFQPAEFAVYFDDDPASEENARLIAAFPRRLSWTRVTVAAAATAAAPLPGVPVPIPGRRRGPPTVTISSAAAAPPAGSHWWDAEQVVRQVLEADGWTVVDVTRFGVGYDLRAKKAGTTRYVEVKSSAGRCSPMLTNNEYMEARRLGSEYVLAVVENFDPVKPAAVLWIQNPARLNLSARQVTAFAVPRSQWLPQATAVIR
jgi:hypothetical protein